MVSDLKENQQKLDESQDKTLGDFKEKYGTDLKDLKQKDEVYGKSLEEL